MSKRSKPGRAVKRTLADGSVKTYHYPAYKPRNRHTPDSLDALIRAYRRSPAWAALAERTREHYSIYMRPLEEIGQIAVKAMGRREIVELRDALAIATGTGAANAFISTASVLFGWAVEQGWIAHSPVHRVKKLPGGHLPAWSNAQAEAALSSLPEHMRRVVILGLYTGQRRGDLASVEWAAYDGATLRIIQQKTGARIVLTVHPDLKAELDAWRPEDAAGPILINGRGKPWTANSLSVMMSRWLRDKGLPPGLNVHGMRKLFAAGMADGGTTTHEIAANTGHKTLAMVQLYTATVDQQKLSQRAVGKLATWKNATKTQS